MSNPVAMRTGKRHVDPHFLPAECLFRRVPLPMWDDPEEPLGVEAVKLPDMSVGRSKYGHPEWVRFDVISGAHHEEWAVVGVHVEDIPPELWKEGVFLFEFRPFHAPLEKDYPHSEIRACQDGIHIDLEEKLPEDIHLKFRERLLRKTKIIIKPYQQVKVRDKAPISHVLEPFTVAS